MNFEPFCIRLFDFKTGDEAGIRRSGGVPISRDLLGIRKIEHRIQDRLFRQARRESRISGGGDPFQFFRADGTVEDQ
jgi:hypothetical protein